MLGISGAVEAVMIVNFCFSVVGGEKWATKS